MFCNSDAEARAVSIKSRGLASGFVFKHELPEPQANNSNPNYAKIREYGRIEWQGSTATLIAAGSRPLHMAALTLSTCLGVSVSAEEPRYRYFGDLLDVTAPQWVAKHPDQRVYAANPAKVNITFAVGPDNSPVDLPGLLQKAATEVNEQQPFNFEVRSRVESARTYYGFVPTKTHDEHGNLIDALPYLDERISIPRQTAGAYELAQSISEPLTNVTGFHFSCCQMMGFPGWGGGTLTYEATNEPARKVLLDLIVSTGENRSYWQTCQPMEKRWCFIQVRRDVDRKPPERNSNLKGCSALGYDGY